MRSGALLNLLKETGAIMNGHFLLTSGRHSNVYIEKFRVLENPAALDEVCREMAEIVKNQNIELVLGAAIGVPLEYDNRNSFGKTYGEW